MSNSKKIISVLLSLVLAFGSLTMLAVPAGAADVASTGVLDASKCLNFDVTTTGWSDFGKVGFYIVEVGGDEWKPWGHKSLFNSEETSSGIWSFDPEANGFPIKYGQYYVIFVSQNTGAQTAPLLFDSSCLGDTAYCNGKAQENEVDSNKISLVARWRNSSLGPMKCITSIGNVVGETIPDSITLNKMMIDFLCVKLKNARAYSGKTDQQLLDDIGAALGLTKDDVEDDIKESGKSVTWQRKLSSLPPGSGVFEPDQYGYTIKSYYLVGSIQGDNSGIADVHKDLVFEETDTDDMKLSRVSLKAGDKVKVAMYNGGLAFTIYPDGTGREIPITQTGLYDFYFKPYELGNPNYWYITPMFVGEGSSISVSGNITSYLSDTEPITVSMMKGGNTEYTTTEKGESASYSFENVEPGAYTITVSKEGHVTREYAVTVGDSDVSQDVTICPLGDINGDGETDVLDATVGLRYIRKLRELDDYQIKCGDVFGDGDGEVDVNDISRILRHVRKLKPLY